MEENFFLFYRTSFFIEFLLATNGIVVHCTPYLIYLFFFEILLTTRTGFDMDMGVRYK